MGEGSGREDWEKGNQLSKIYTKDHLAPKILNLGVVVVGKMVPKYPKGSV